MVRPSSLTAFVILGAAAGIRLSAGGAMSAQERPGTAAATPQDSIRAHAAAVGFLRTFEFRHTTFIRREGSVTQFAGGIYGSCEISVGDYCYGPRNGGLAFGGAGTSAYSGVLSPNQYFRQFRNRSNSYVSTYLTELRRQRRVIPGDRWINGEIVRVELERGDFIRAMGSLDECRAEAWWCGALKAYVMNAAGVWRRADSAWTEVLGQMPEPVRCQWLDPTWIVRDEKFAAAFGAADCPAKLVMAERMWWLSDPLYSIAGNERRSEHLSRWVELMLLQAYKEHRIMTPAMAQAEKVEAAGDLMQVSKYASTPEAALIIGAGSNSRVRFNFGMPELVMRVGVPEFTAAEENSDLVIAQYPTHRAAFVPSADVLLDHLRAEPGGWNVNDREAFEFMSSWAQPVRDLEYQVAHFRRGDSSLVIAATDVTGDTLLAYSWLAGGIFVRRDFDTQEFRQDRIGRGLVQFSLTVPPDSALVSIELVDSTGLSGRVRFASGSPAMPEQRVTLSDVLLIEPGEPLPATSREAAWRALGTTHLNPGVRVGLFWEMYGLRQGEQPRITVHVSPGEQGLLGRLATSLNLRRRADTLSVRWEEPPVAGDEVEPRAINLDLSSLPVGEYTLSLAVEIQGDAAVVSRRAIEIRIPPRMRM